MLKLVKIVMSGLLIVLPSLNAQAAEVSLINGFYQSEKIDNGLETTEISFGGRYMEYMSARMAWFAEGGLSLKSFSAPSNEPDNTNDISLGGGVRQFFPKMSESITPYATGRLAYINRSDNHNWGAAATTWRQVSGLQYAGDVGLRFGISDAFFMEIETNLFTSNLSVTETGVAKTPAGETKNDTTRTDLYIDTQGAVATATISLGMEL